MKSIEEIREITRDALEKKNQIEKEEIKLKKYFQQELNLRKE